MKTTSFRGTLITTACVLTTLLAACNQSTPPAPPAASAPVAGATQPETFLGRTVEGVMRNARHKLETGNLDLNHGVDIKLGSQGQDFRIGGDAASSRAEITPQGDFLVDGKSVATTPEQRRLLQDYRQQVITIAEIGMTLGVQGADLAGKAMSEAISGALHGDSEAAGKRIEAQGALLEANAKQICRQLPGMRESQQRLAASLPQFKPYATMTQENVDDCMKGHGVAVTDAGKAQTRNEIRDEIRQDIRNSIRGSVQGGATDDKTAQPAADDKNGSTPPR